LEPQMQDTNIIKVHLRVHLLALLINLVLL